MSARPSSVSEDATPTVHVAGAEPSPRRRARPRLRQGQTVGRYLVLERIGAGGMGEVYRAWDDRLRREVALKLLRTGATASDVDAAKRLVTEAQALAQLSHPNVVAVYDVGELDEGVFVAMELVDGVTLRRYFAEHRRTREVLRVMLQAADGLDAAHRAGLVHRDFKPANVMVGSDGRVRVMDFGLARGVDGGSASTTGPQPRAHRPDSSASGPVAAALTDPNVVMGTPAYMAPEQHYGETIDARVDVFAFCVTLHEGLYDARPFPVPLRELSAAIEAGPPAMAASGAAGSVPGWLRDAIARGLAADPGDRWPSVEALATCLRRGLGARRRRLWVAAMVAGGVGLVAAPLAHSGGRDDPCAGASAAWAEVWDDARAAAIAQRYAAVGTEPATRAGERLRAFVGDYEARWVGSRRDACEATMLRGEQSGDLMDRRIACLDRRRDELDAVLSLVTEGEAPVDATNPLLRTVAAVAECEDAELLGATLPPPEGPQVRAAVDAVRRLEARSRALVTAGRVDASVDAARDALTAAEATQYAPVVLEAKYRLATNLESQGHADVARPMLEEVYFESMRTGHRRTAVWAGLDIVYMEASRSFDAAMAWARHVEATIDHLDWDEARINYELVVASTYFDHGDFEDARTHYERGLALRSRVGAPTDAEEATAHANYASALAQLGHRDRAEAETARAIEIWTELHGPDHPHIGVTLYNAGMGDLDRADYARARERFERALAILEKALGPEHPNVAEPLRNLGNVIRETGDPEAAMPYYARALAIVRKAFPDGDARVAVALSNYGWCLVDLGRLDEAEPYMNDALAMRREILGPDHFEVARSLGLVALLERQRERYPEAIAASSEALAILEAQFGADSGELLGSLSGLAEAELAAGRPGPAIEHLRRALRIGPSDPRYTPSRQAATRLQLGRALYAAGKRDEARAEGIGAREELRGDADPEAGLAEAIDAFVAEL